MATRKSTNKHHAKITNVKSTDSKTSEAAKSGEAKQIVNAASTGNAGGSFESRVQAVKLLSLAMGVSSPGIPEGGKLVKLHFQARIHGIHTDDLVCIVENGDRKNSRLLIQIKRGLKAQKSSKAFEEAIGNAWLDFCSKNFARMSDKIIIVHDAGTANEMRGAQEVTRIATTSTLSTEWVEKINTVGVGNAIKRNALNAITACVKLYAKETYSEEELFQFVRHVEFVCHDLDFEGTNEHHQYLNLIALASTAVNFNLAPNFIWSKLVTACMGLNAIAGSVDKENLAQIIGGDLAILFEGYQNRGINFRYHSKFLRSDPDNESFMVNVEWSNPKSNFQSSLASEIEQLPNARTSSVNKLISRQLDHINERLKAGKYTEVAAALSEIGRDLGPLDPHQRGRWYHMRGICKWHQDDLQDAAEDFIAAAALCDDDDKLVASGIRGLILKKENDAAVKAGNDALSRFPDSLQIWIATVNARFTTQNYIEFSEVPTIHSGSADAIQLIAFGYHLQGRLSDARELGLKALGSTNPSFFVRNMVLGFVLEDITCNPMVHQFGVKEGKDKRDLELCLQAFEPRHEKLWSIEAPTQQLEAAYRLAFAYLLLNSPMNAISVLDECEVRQFESTDLFRIRIEALIQLGEVQRVFTLAYDKLETLPIGALISLGNLAGENEKISTVEEIIEIAEHKFPLETSAIELLKSFRWSTLSKLNMKDIVLPEILAIDLNQIKSITLLTMAARVAYKFNLANEAYNYASHAKTLVGEGTKVSELFLLARLLMHLKIFDDASRFFEIIVEKGRLTDWHNDLLYCYIESGQRAAAIKLIREFPPGWEANSDSRQLAIKLGQTSGDWKLLDSLVEEQLKSAPKQATSWLFKLMVVLRGNIKKETRNTIDIPEELEGTIQHLTQIATFELQEEKTHKKGLRRLYRMWRCNSSSSEAAAAYISAFLLLEECIVSEKNFETVCAGTCIEISEASGTSLFYTIDPEELENLPQIDEFRSPYSQDIQVLLGLSVGSEFNVKDSFGGERKYSIVSIRSSHSRVLELSYKSLKVSLTPPKSLTIMTFDTDDNGEINIDKFVSKLNENEKHARDIFELYQTHKFTLGLTAKLLSRDVVSLVRDWPVSDYPLLVCNGTIGEREAASQIINGDKKSVVIDAAALTELALLRSLHTLSAFETIFISSTTYSIFLDKLSRAKLDRSSGIARARDGKISFHELTSDSHRLNVNFFSEICEEIESNCQVVPSYGPINRPNELTEVESVISQEEYDTLLVALEYDSPLLLLDQHLRQMAEYCGLKAIWPQILLLNALEIGCVSRGAYGVASSTMFLRNRSFVSLQAEDLLTITYQGGAFFDIGMRRFVAHIASDSIEFDSAERVIFDYFQLIVSQGNCQFGVILELVERLFEGLFRNKKCPEDFLDRASYFLISIIKLNSLGSRVSTYLIGALRNAKKHAREEPQNSSIKASVLYCSTPPFIQSGLNTVSYLKEIEEVELEQNMRNLDVDFATATAVKPETSTSSPEDLLND